LLAYFIDDDDLWRGELDFVENAIGDDVRNNSAWHHRYFIVFGCRVRPGEEDRARVARRELTYVLLTQSTLYLMHQNSFTKQSISLAPNNPSAWNYLRGILDHMKLPYSLLARFVKPYTVPLGSQRVDVVDLENPPPSPGAQLPCVHALEFMADIHEQTGVKDNILRAVEVKSSPFIVSGCL